METNKLFIFSKDTDAYSAQRGYNYQTLKTLETWTENYLNKINEDIYCEYEEDIFQKNSLLKEAKFRQIKLYSGNFSFNSDEVQKCVFHFLILHIKSDYTDFNKEFVFETNTDISRNYTGNDADLLREWYRNQDNIPSEKLANYAEKIKDIVTAKISQSSEKLKQTITEEEIEEAKEIFSNLDDSFWLEFTKLIKWKFIGSSPDIEYSNVKERIESLILQLPFSEVIGERLNEFYGVLLEKVFTISVNEEVEDRKLTTSLFEKTILDIGDKDDKWYSKKFRYYEHLDEIESFRIGEFYEILNLINYCRRKKYLHIHKDKWNSLLEYYTKNTSINPILRKKAIYELIFLNLNSYEVDYENLKDRERPDGSLKGFEDEIIYYFKDFKEFHSTKELENAQNILNLVFPAIMQGQIEISEEQLKKWAVQLYKEINLRLNTVPNKNEKCNLLEQKGNFLQITNRLRPNKNNHEFIQYYYEILDLLDDASLFPVSKFGERLDKYIKIHIIVDPEDKDGTIKVLEEFSEKLFPYVEKREGKLQLAKTQVQRGIQYLNQKGQPFLMLKALDYFHKAKINYQHEDSMEGYVLALLNIGQLYNALGMHYAAKYYVLGAFRVSMNKELTKRIETSLAMLFYCDFKQGAWFNAIDRYDKYIIFRDSLNLERDDYDEEGKITQRISLILYIMQRKFNQYKYFIDDFLRYLDYIGSDIILPIFSFLEKEFKSEKDFEKLLEGEFDDVPINDVGKTREVSFYALGSLWKFKFSNDYKTTSIAEEFIANCQIFFAEIALFEYDFHLLKTVIEVELELSNEYKEPIQLASNEIVKRKVFISFFDSNDLVEANKHTVVNTVSIKYVLDSISLLKNKVFQEQFFKFIKDRELDNKQMSVNIYQRIHRDIYLEEDFDIFKKQDYQKEDLGLSFIKENHFMKWNDSISHLYNQEGSLEAIKNRYINSKKPTHRTLDVIKNRPEFHVIINKYRSEDWRDWQIVSNIMNFITNYKVQRFERDKLENINDDAILMETYQSLTKKYIDMDENDCYIYFPVEAFETDEFISQFNIGLISILKSYGLECKLETPPFAAIRRFLNIKFNLDKDDINENNPLKNIVQA